MREARDTTVEAVARAMLAAERCTAISDEYWNILWNDPTSMTAFRLKAQARAALSVLAANVSDEMVEAAENGMSEKQFLTLPREEMRRAIAAAISAAGDEDRSDLCAEANAFAMELLMPEFLLRPELEKLGGIDIEDSKAISKLAAKFRVSTQMMTLRLGELMREK